MHFLVVMLVLLVVFVVGFIVGGTKTAGEFRADIDALRQRAEAAEKAMAAVRNGASANAKAAKSAG